MWFKFDEGTGNLAHESITGTSTIVPGDKTLWKRGISGTAFEFDGYHTSVSIPADKAPVVSSGSLTLEAWFALGAYPWNWVPVIQQGDHDGYFLGIDSHGYPGFMLKLTENGNNSPFPANLLITIPTIWKLFYSNVFQVYTTNLTG